MTDVGRFLLGNAIALLIAAIALSYSRAILQRYWKTFVALVGIELVLINLHMWAWFDLHQFWRWFLNLDVELTLGAMVSSGQLLIIGIAALPLILQSNSILPRLYWIVFALWFGFLSFDEYFALHEQLSPNTFIGLYLTIGVLLAALTVLVWNKGQRQNTGLYTLLLLGFFTFGIGGLAIESGTLMLADRWPWFHNVWLVSIVVEEFLEMIGASLVLVTVLALRDTQTQARLMRLAPLFALWIVCLVVYVWVLPSWQARDATQAIATFNEDKLQLIGYEVARGTGSDAQKIVQPGDTMVVHTYWKTTDFLKEHYTFSMHALTQPDQLSVAQFNVIGSDYNVASVDYPSAAWVPGRTVQISFPLTFSADIETMRSYLLALSVDAKDGFLTVAESESLQLAPQTIALDYVAYPEFQLDPATQFDAVRFTEDQIAFDLTEVRRQIPTQVTVGDSFDLTYTWYALDAAPRDLTQFIHLVSSDGTTFYTVDRVPFDQQYPISQWVPRSASTDTVTFTVPADALPGDYDVYTGLYAWPSLERAAVVNPQGETYINRTVPLGSLQITAP